MSAIPIAPTRTPSRRVAGAALAAALLLLGGAQAPAGEAPLLAARTPLSEAELAALRGGFITEDGLEITFGMRLKFNLDNEVQFVAEFQPALDRGKARDRGNDRQRGRAEKSAGAFVPGEFRASFRRSGAQEGEDAVTTVERKADGSIAVSGGPDEGIRPAASPGIAIPGGTAEIENRGDGFVLAADGEVPIRLEQGADGIVVVIGDARTTLIEDRLGPDGFSAQLSNRRNGADVLHEALLDIDVHNFSELSTVRKAGAQRQRLQRLVSRGMVDFGARR